jgi:ketosteroid isomerase-like protein
MRKMKTLGIVCSLALASTLLLAQAAKSAGAEQALKDIETKWAAAYLKGDAAAIGEYLADDFVSVSAEGKVMSRADVLSEAKKSQVTRSAVSDMRVRVLDADAAIISGVWSGAGSDPAGKKFETSNRWTDVFVKKDGKWKCVSSQSTTITK